MIDIKTIKESDLWLDISDARKTAVEALDELINDNMYLGAWSRMPDSFTSPEDICIKMTINQIRRDAKLLKTHEKFLMDFADVCQWPFTKIEWIFSIVNLEDNMADLMHY